MWILDQQLDKCQHNRNWNCKLNDLLLKFLCKLLTNKYKLNLFDMLYFIVFCQLYSVFSKDLEKKFENTIGLQQFSIKTLIKNPFPEL